MTTIYRVIYCSRKRESSPLSVSVNYFVLGIVSSDSMSQL